MATATATATFSLYPRPMVTATVTTLHHHRHAITPQPTETPTRTTLSPMVTTTRPPHLSKIRSLTTATTARSPLCTTRLTRRAPI
jgi:hypothetical protein